MRLPPRPATYGDVSARARSCRVGAHARSIDTFAGARAPGSVPAPGLPALLGRAARVPHRHMDAERGAIVARPGTDGLALPAGAGEHAAVHAHPSPLRSGRRPERPP